MSQMPPAPPPGYGGQPPYGAPPPPAPPGYGPPAPGYGQYPAPKTSGAAIASLVCGVLGCIPYITSLLAIILGAVGIRNTGRPGVKGRGMAIAGLLLGLLGIVLWSAFGGLAWALISGSKPARDAAKQFANHLGSGNVQAAQAMCTSQVTPQQLQLAAQKLQSWGGVQDTTLVGFSVNNNAGESVSVVGGAIHLPGNEQATYAVQFTKENGALKVQGFTIQRAKTNETVTGGAAPNRGATGSGSSSGSSSSGDGSSSSDQ